MEKICVYTCITGNYDDLKEVEVKEKGIDYICFTNNKKIKSKTWKIIYIEDKKLDNHYLSRKIKMIGDSYIDKNYSLSIYIDASIIFKKSVKEFLEKYFDLENDLLAACKHSVRSSIREEAEACIKQRKDDETTIKRQLEFYKKENFVDDLGLLEMTLIIKRHNNLLVKKTMKLWFDMILKYSKRDQLSFMYCLSKTKLPFRVIPLNVWNNDYLDFTPHNKDDFDYTYKIYYDYGAGFNEQDSEKFEYINLGDKYLLDFKLKKEVNSLRIDLADVDGIAFEFINMEGILKEKLIWEDFLLYNNKYISNSSDPKMIINNELEKDTEIIITINIKELSKRDFLNIISYAIEEENAKEQLQYKVNKMQHEIDKIFNSTSWKVTKPLRYLSSKLKR